MFRHWSDWKENKQQISIADGKFGIPTINTNVHGIVNWAIYSENEGSSIDFVIYTTIVAVENSINRQSIMKKQEAIFSTSMKE